MPELTPIRDSRISLVQRYGEGRFRISGEVHEGSVVVLPELVRAAPCENLAELVPSELISVLGEDVVDVLLVGCGGAVPRLKPELSAALKEAGIAAEPMDTGAACRTFNVLVSEGRRVGALLFAID